MAIERQAVQGLERVQSRGAPMSMSFTPRQVSISGGADASGSRFWKT